MSPDGKTMAFHGNHGYIHILSTKVGLFASFIILCVLLHNYCSFLCPCYIYLCSFSSEEFHVSVQFEDEWQVEYADLLN